MAVKSMERLGSGIGQYCCPPLARDFDDGSACKKEAKNGRVWFFGCLQKYLCA